MRRTWSWWVFWASIAATVYAYVGYPVLLLLRGIFFPRKFQRGEITPSVSLVIAAYNEADFITRNLDSVLALDYPADKLEILVASDGSDDGTNELVKAYNHPQLRLLELPRQGKNRTLNTAIGFAKGEIIAFTDADSIVRPDSLRRLIAPFADPSVGGVSGDYRYPKDIEEGVGERTYWSFDRWLKRIQSQAGNMISGSGQLYAIRREHFRPIPDGASDDFFVSVQPISNGQRLVFEPDAVVSGPVTVSDDAEFSRKIRVLIRGFNGVWEVRHMLNPLRYKFYALQLFSHKILRRLVGIPMIVAALSAPLLWRRGWLYKLATLGQFGLHGLAVIGYLLRGSNLGRKKFFSMPFFLDMVNVAGIIAFVRLLRGKRQDVWTTQRSTEETPQA